MRFVSAGSQRITWLGMIADLDHYVYKVTCKSE